MMVRESSHDLHDCTVAAVSQMSDQLRGVESNYHEIPSAFIVSIHTANEVHNGASEFMVILIKWLYVRIHLEVIGKSKL